MLGVESSSSHRRVSDDDLGGDVTPTERALEERLRALDTATDMATHHKQHIGLKGENGGKGEWIMSTHAKM